MPSIRPIGQIGSAPRAKGGRQKGSGTSRALRLWNAASREGRVVEGVGQKMGRVCQLVHTLNVGGAEILAERFSRHLGGPDRVFFACLDAEGSMAPRLAAEGYQIHSLRRTPGWDVGCLRRLASLWSHEKVEWVHAHQYTPFFYASLSRLFGPRVPILFTEHGRFFPDYPHRKRMWLNPHLARERDRLVAVGECVKRALVDYEGFPAERIEVVYNGVDLDRYRAADEIRPRARQDLGLSDDDFAIVMVARLDPIKDHATALAAMAAVRSRCPHAKLLIAGDGPERAAIERRREELGLSAHVRLLGQRSDVDRLLAAADLFLLCSVSEGIPLTVIEAMGSARPVLATRVGGLAEVVISGQSGWLVEPSNSGALADAIVTLASDPTLRLRLANAGQARAHERFTERQMIERYLEIEREMAGPRT